MNTLLKVRLFEAQAHSLFYHLNFPLSLPSKPHSQPWPQSARRKENHHPLLPQAIKRQRLWNTPKAKEEVERRKLSDLSHLKGPDRKAGGKHTQGKAKGRRKTFHTRVEAPFFPPSEHCRSGKVTIKRGGSNSTENTPGT